MRIIAGENKGRRLETPEGRATRPTTDRVRESLMSMIGSARGTLDLQGAIVLDAFAGSGALGLEALSRGADSVQFYERRADAYRVLCSNIHTLGYGTDRAVVHRCDVLSVTLESIPPFNLVFLDPPYALDASEVFALLSRAERSGVLSDDVVISYEHDPLDCEATNEQIKKSNFALLTQRKYAGVMVNIMKRKGE